MKITRTMLAIYIVSSFLLGLLAGFTIKLQRSQGLPIDVNPFSQSCQYNGKTYKSGEGFPSVDGCNSCSCIDGKIACTLMACQQSQ